MGRTTEKAFNRDFSEGVEFLRMADSIGVSNPSGVKPIVSGKHLIAKGIKPSPEFSKILDKCKEVQFEKGLTDVEAILNEVL
jgi:hypothetical protein